MTEGKIYLKDTIGYHWQMSKVVFGPESSPVKWLEAKAAESPGGMDEPVVQEEGQVVHLLAQMWLKERGEQGPA